MVNDLFGKENTFGLGLGKKIVLALIVIMMSVVGLCINASAQSNIRIDEISEQSNNRDD